MKKKKIHFSLMNYFEPISSEVIKLQTQFKALSATLLVSSYVSDNASFTLGLTVVFFVLNELIGCVSIIENE